MKTALLTFLTTLVLSGSSVYAANVAWVSFHSADDAPSGNAAGVGFTNAPDAGYTALLTTNGHVVTRFVTVDSVDTFPDLLAAFNTNDLVIISRSVPSGHYQQANETAAWNGIAKPVMILGGYIIRGGTATAGNARLGLTTGETIPDANSNPVRLRVNVPSHPIFAGVALDATNLMVNPYAQLATYTNWTTGATVVQRGISVNNNPPAAGGTILASIGTAGDAALNGMVIGELPAGASTTHFADVLGGKRLIFLTGGREANGISADSAGVYDLQPDGAKLFLNAVTYLVTTAIPQAPKCNTPLVTASNLIAGESWTFNAGVIGDPPLTYQWYWNSQPYVGATNASLVFTSLDPTNAGQYQLYVTNALGSATSTVARLEFFAFPQTSITNGIISYWPLNAVAGTKSVDDVSGYDMTLVNMTASDLVPGKWGNAFQFNGTNSLLERLHNAGEDLPIYQHANFTVSAWVNGLVQSDRRVFSEGSLTDTDPMFDFGTHNSATAPDGTVDVFIRNDTGGTSGDHRHSVATAYDGTWHNVVYVQRDLGGGNMRAQLWVDGVPDTVVITPVRPLTANTTAIGGLRRASASSWFAGMVDEVAVWNRPLSSDEVAILQVTSITNPPSRVQPLAINNFRADLPAVVSGRSTTLRWDVSKDATQVTINPLGDVTAQTSVGVGARSVTNTQATTYVLTVTRGVDTLSATTSVAVVQGVAPGWNILDDFDLVQTTNLAGAGYWNDTTGAAGQIVTVNGNRAVRTTSPGISFLNLRSLSIQETQICTLFFRIIAGTNTAAGVTNIIGLTDKSQRAYADEFSNIGPVLYPTPFTNTTTGIESNAWYLGARNGPGSPIDYLGNQPESQLPLDFGGVYNVWVDITNAPLALSMNDMFSVYIQKEGGAPRKLLFQDYTSDRDLVAVDPVLGGFLPVLDKLVLMGNSATLSAVFDDFYLSTSGYNATVPKPYGVALTPGPLSVGWSGNQLQINWTNGTLQSSTNVGGPFFDVPGNPASPHLITPSGGGTFYRTRQ